MSRSPDARIGVMQTIYTALLTVSGFLFIHQAFFAARLDFWGTSALWAVCVGLVGLGLLVDAAFEIPVRWSKAIGVGVVVVTVWRTTGFLASAAGYGPEVLEGDWARAWSAGLFWLTVGAYTGTMSMFAWNRNIPGGRGGHGDPPRVRGGG